MADPVPSPVAGAPMAQAVAWHRQVAAMVEAADRAGVAPAELPGLRQRITTQAGLLTQAATRSGGPLPALVPTPAEIAIAAQALGDLSAEAVASAVRTMNTTLAAVDAALGVGSSDAPPAGGTAAGAPGNPSGAAIPTQTAPEPGHAQAHGGPGNGQGGASAPTATAVAELARRPVGLRNAAVYGAYSVPVLALQAFLFVLLDEANSLPAAAPLCLLVLPALAFFAGYLTIGTLFPAPPGEKVNHTPRLGVVICLLPDALLCAGLGVLWIAQLFG